jgi:ATP-dependent DNA helicase DinG
MKTFADAEAVLAQALPGYESRRPQQVLAEGVERVFSNKAHFTPYTGTAEEYENWVRPGLQHFLGQAGTGTGKSLGYLIPALLSGKRVIVSVTTKALQSQLARKDLPFLAEHLGLDFSWSVLKGRANYLCINRVALITEADVPELPEIVRLIQTDLDFDGDRESIQRAIGREIAYTSWALIGADAEECQDNNCDQTNCYAEKARAKARKSDVVIANHALFFTDLVVKSKGVGGMLGEYDAVIFDEAHEMEEVAGSTLGASLSQGSFNSVSAQVRRWARDHADDDTQSIDPPLGVLAAATLDLFVALGEGRLTDGKIEEAAMQFGAVYDAVENLRTALYETTLDHASDHDKAYKRKRSLLRMVNNLAEKLADIVAAPQTQIVRWVDVERTRRGEERKVIKTAPILVAPFLFKWLFSKTPCVLVSATLAVKQSFDYIVGRLGIGPAIEGIDVGTPFDFPTQGRLYVPTNLPEPKGADQAAWQAMATNEIAALIKASNGRALVLFTSVAHMRQSRQALEMMCPGLEFMMQYDAPTGDLTDWLKDHDPSRPGRVLLATKSFFTGVDIPGEALSLVVVTKMPFPRPGEALTDARQEAIEAAGGNAFNDYVIPVMSLVLQQALGRLIRHRDDKGVVAILDPRMLTKGYGRRILGDLPPFGRVHDLDEVRAFIDTPMAAAV